MPDYPTLMSISATMRFSHPPCYLQDQNEIADDVIISQPRKRYIKITALSVHPFTVQSGISSRATVASIKVLFGGVKASFQPFSCLNPQLFAPLEAVFQLRTGQFASFPA